MSRLALLLALASLLTLAVAPVVVAQGPDEVRDFIKLVYSELADAERRGANVTEAALKLNEALTLVREAEREADATRRAELLSRALSLAEEVRGSIPSLIEEGRTRAWWRSVTLASSVAFVIVGFALTYLYAPKIVWGLWLRARKDWKVRRA